jgi:surface antigen
LFQRGDGKDVARNAINAGIANASDVPVVGGYVSFAPGVELADRTRGHVAIVEKVYPDGSYLISECAGGRVNSYNSTRVITPPYGGMTFTD